MCNDPKIQAAARTLWDFHCLSHPVEPADVIIGLGSYGLRVAQRCADMYRDGLADHVLFTGASVNWTGGLFLGSEAQAFADHARQAGVPDGAIIVEPHATNIGQNIQFSAQLVPTATRAILVTKPQTQRRCWATVCKQWPGVTALVTAPLHGFDDQPTAHHGLRALICEMVGDLERIRTYPALGYQVAQPIPDQVAVADQILRAAGFTDHLP